MGNITPASSIMSSMFPAMVCLSISYCVAWVATYLPMVMRFCVGSQPTSNTVRTAETLGQIQKSEQQTNQDSTHARKQLACRSIMGPLMQGITRLRGQGVAVGGALRRLPRCSSPLFCGSCL